jgi:putative colanic acid biosynthesis glycosyltransferase
MKKILIINTALDIGGASKVARYLQELQNTKFTIHYAYGRKSNLKTANSFYFGNKFETYIHAFTVRFLGIEGYGSYFSTKKLIQYIQKEKIDIINIHNLHGYYINIFSLLTFIQKNNIPTILSIHDEWPLTWLPAHSMGCEHCKKGTGICTNSYTYPKTFSKLFVHYVLQKKQKAFLGIKNLTLISPSDWLTAQIKNSYLKNTPLHTVYNGVDTDVFKPRDSKQALRKKYSLPLHKKIVLFLASSLRDKNKGISHILEAAKSFTREGYLFIGIGNNAGTTNKDIFYTGYIQDSNILADYYSLSDVFCSASTAETFSLSSAEALSCETPVVAFTLPALTHLIPAHVGIVTDHTSEALAKGISQLLNTTSINTMGHNGRQHIKEYFSKKKFLTQYEQIFDQLTTCKK